MSYVECNYKSCGNPVFSRGICRKHYEHEKVAAAPPCSMPDCSNNAYRGDLCAMHYRVKMNARKPLCIVPNCGNLQHSLTTKLCNRHSFRARKHGTMEQPRADDWGSREAHDYYGLWAWHKRTGMCEEWRNDFWEFVRAIGQRPDGSTLRRHDVSGNLGPDNWYWKEKIPSKDKAKYQRIWRAANPEQAKSHSLKSQYGIGMDEYRALSEAQNGVCAICKNTETSLDKDGGPRLMPVDHDHITGKVRGLLCTACNRALGMFKDSPELLRSAINYLEKNKEPQ
jgi:hypothetical protein